MAPCGITGYRPSGPARRGEVWYSWPRGRRLRLLRDALPAPGQPNFPRTFDLLIVDEAHNVAPSGSGKYATDSERTHTIRTLVPHFEHRLFLSATPHNG